VAQLTDNDSIGLGCKPDGSPAACDVSGDSSLELVGKLDWEAQRTIETK